MAFIMNKYNSKQTIAKAEQSEQSQIAKSEQSVNNSEHTKLTSRPVSINLDLPEDENFRTISMKEKIRSSVIIEMFC